MPLCVPRSKGKESSATGLGARAAEGSGSLSGCISLSWLGKAPAAALPLNGASPGRKVPRLQEKGKEEQGRNFESRADVKTREGT